MWRSTVVLTLLALLVAHPGAAQYKQRQTTEQTRAQIHYRAGWESMRSERFDEAASRFQQAIDLDPKLTLAYYGLGRANVERRRYVEAIRAYTTCRTIYLTRASTKYNAEADANRAREDELMELKELQRQNSNGPQTATTQNNQRLIQNRIRFVQDNLDRNRTLDMDYSVPAFVSLALGSAYFRAQRLDDAEREYKAALQTDRSIGEAHNNLAVVYMLTGRLADADQEIKLAEKNGVRVSADLKQELADRRKQQ